MYRKQHFFTKVSYDEASKFKLTKKKQKMSTNAFYIRDKIAYEYEIMHYLAAFLFVGAFFSDVQTHKTRYFLN